MVFPRNLNLIGRHNVYNALASSAAAQTQGVSMDKIKEIAEIKMPDLNAYNIDHAMRIVEGTARSCGITVVD